MFEKGQSGNPNGRPKGSPNKATSKAREAIANFVDGNSDKIQSWLDEVYTEKGAEAALSSFMGFLEYHVPKLARTEIESEHKGNLTVEIVRFGENTATGQ